MNSNRIFMFSTLCALAIVAVLIGIYALTNVQSVTSSALTDHGEKKKNERLAKLSLPHNQVSGTVLDVVGQIVAVQRADSPFMISFVYVNGDIPTGLAAGKTVIMNGEFKNGLCVTDNITITEGTPRAVPETSPQPLGLVDRMIFFIAYWVS